MRRKSKKSALVGRGGTFGSNIEERCGTMVKDDMIYQVLLKHDFDLYRGNSDIAEFMKDHLKNYYENIAAAVKRDNPFLGKMFASMLSEKLEELNYICEEIPAVLDAFNNGHIMEAYNEGTQLFAFIKPYFLKYHASNGDFTDYYRIRQGDHRIKEASENKRKKAELFHIKRTSRDRIGAYRYSVAGYPCLYLASDIELAWFECGMPKQFSYARLTITGDEDDGLMLIDLSRRPIEFLSAVTTWILNARRKDDHNVMNYYDILIRYILTYPLAAACSVKVKNRNSKFVEEYIFPQLLMYWIRESSDIDGVKYKSSLYSTLVQGMGAVNVALPAKKFRFDGLDERLTKKIAISDIGYLDVNSDFKRYQSALQELKTFKDELRIYTIESAYAGDYVMEIIDLCDSIFKTYTALIEGDYSNSELIFTHVDRLCDHVDLLYQCKEKKMEECVMKAFPHQKESIDPTVINYHFEKFYQIAERILNKHAVFHFSFENLGNVETI